MGGRGSGSGRGGGSANIGALKEKEKSLNSQIDKLNKRLADYASKNPAWNMPSGYYDVQRKKQALESKKRSITNKSSQAKLSKEIMGFVGGTKRRK